MSLKKDDPALVNTSVERALSILEYIIAQKNGTTLAELSAELDIPKSTAYRLLETLRQKDYVRFQETSERYSIGMKMVDVGILALNKMEIVDVVIPYLRDLAERTGETAFLGIYNEGKITYLYKAEGTHSITINSKLGSRRPVHCTGLGKAIISGFQLEKIARILEDHGMERFTEKTITNPADLYEEIAQVKINGYAMDDEELEEGLSCFAGPIHDFTGNVIASICVSGPTERIKRNDEMLIKLLKETCAQISRRFGFVSNMKK